MAKRSRKGKLIVYKKLTARDSDGILQVFVAELEVAAKTPRVFPSGLDGKARCEKATVLRIWKRRTRLVGTTDGYRREESKGWRELKAKDTSILHRGFGGAHAMRYTKGQEVVAHYYNPDPNQSCVGGIHFLMTIEAARKY